MTQLEDIETRTHWGAGPSPQARASSPAVGDLLHLWEGAMSFALRIAWFTDPDGNPRARLRRPARLGKRERRPRGVADDATAVTLRRRCSAAGHRAARERGCSTPASHDLRGAI